MNSNIPSVSDFIHEVGNLVSQFSWPMKHFQRESETVCVALTEQDEVFERIVWVYNTEQMTLRCLLVGENKIDQDRRAEIYELCSRVNDSLPFGCMEYSFEEDVIVFRDSADLELGPLKQLLESTTAKVLNLGDLYSGAMKQVLGGVSAKIAISMVDE